MKIDQKPSKLNGWMIGEGDGVDPRHGFVLGSVSGVGLQGYLAHKKQRPPRGPKEAILPLQNGFGAILPL